MSNLIKPYAFVDFFNDKWYDWKTKKLDQALLEARRHNKSLSYAFGRNISKVPITWHADDYKFLSQFPPGLWNEALSWRYNQGIFEISKLREEWYEQHPEINKRDAKYWWSMIPNDRQVLTLEKRDKRTGETTSRFTFRNVWTGYKDLFERLEKPHKYHEDPEDPTKSHNPPGAMPGPGLMNVDPFQTDENAPNHPSKYKNGLYNYDLSAPLEMSDEEIDEMEPHELELELDGKSPTPENVAAAKAAIKQKRRRSMAGFDVLQPGETTSGLLHTWIRAQAYNLLGDTPTAVHDPLTGKVVPVKLGTARDTGPQNVKAKRMGLIQKTDKGESLPEIPIITRHLSYDEETRQKDGSFNKREVSDNFDMPYMNAGRYLPAIRFTPEQQEKVAAIREKNRVKNLQKKGKQVRELSPIEKIRQRQVGSLRELLYFWDILNDDQKKFLRDNHRNTLHIATALHGKNEDPYSQPAANRRKKKKTKEDEEALSYETDDDIETDDDGDKTQPVRAAGYFTVGFHPTKQQQGIVPSDLTTEQVKAVLDKYYDFKPGQSCSRKWTGTASMTRDAFCGTNRFFRSKKNLAHATMKVFENVSKDLIPVCAALLALNINDPHMGVRDELLGLLGAPADLDPGLAQDRREQWAYNFAKNLAQAAFGDKLSRRYLEKGGGLEIASYDDPTAKSKKGAAISAQMSAEEGGAVSGQTEKLGKGTMTSRRRVMKPITWKISDPTTGEDIYFVPRVSWNIPKMGHKFDELFSDTKRRLMAVRAAGRADIARSGDRLKRDLEILQREAIILQDAVEVIADTLRKQGAIKDEEVIQQKAREDALIVLPKLLQDAMPEYYPEDMTTYEKSIIRNRNMQTIEPKVEEQEDDETKQYNDAMDTFFDASFRDALHSENKHNIPTIRSVESDIPGGESQLKFQFGPPIDLKTFSKAIKNATCEDGTPVSNPATLAKYAVERWSKRVNNKHIVPFIMATFHPETIFVDVKKLTPQQRAEFEQKYTKAEQAAIEVAQGVGLQPVQSASKKEANIQKHEEPPQEPQSTPQQPQAVPIAKTPTAQSLPAAAMDISKAVEGLPENPMSVNSIKNRVAELQPYHMPYIDAAINNLTSKGDLNNKEHLALVMLNGIKMIVTKRSQA